MKIKEIAQKYGLDPETLTYALKQEKSIPIRGVLSLSVADSDVERCVAIYNSFVSERDKSIKAQQTSYVESSLSHSEIATSYIQDAKQRLLDKKNCDICGKKASVAICDGHFICSECSSKTTIKGFPLKSPETMTIEEVKERVLCADAVIAEQSKRELAFRITYKVGDVISFDDNQRWIALPNQTAFGWDRGRFFIDYSDLTDYELFENNIIQYKGGLGKAIVGSTFFGIAGAVAGGTSKTAVEMCNRLYIKLRTKNKQVPNPTVTLLTQETPKNGFAYKLTVSYAKQIVDKFQEVIDLIQSENEHSQQIDGFVFSPADEILKYKNLLDIGAITQEEYDFKKKQLLGL